MSIVTTIPWHLYLTMFLVAVTIGLLAAVEIEDLRHGTAGMPLRRDSRDEVHEA